MDDTCAVCAETLEWVAYGPCGHHEVCSTCIARLRFICDDRRCCLCKSESSIIFVTKALGDYTRMINDFSVFPADPTEGQVGQYWYHEGTQAFFDDLDHYKMIKATCRLSCIVCDKMDEQRNEGSKRRGSFRNIEQLKGHLFHSHKLFMCSLCLEGRKIFICEQKLYTRAQLNQHINTGDSEVDGSETERGGFMGHPMCEFCRNPSYGDNELYSHMSTEHYTCHICQRQHPGHYEYFKNYDELEIHFRGDHFLCEDEGCLAKKFIVFTSESEMKRHNALEHGGQMSRSQRSVALQIPTSFRFERRVEQDRRQRRHGFRRDSSDNQLSLAIQASLETANSDSTRATSSGAHADSNYRETNVVTSVLGQLESLTTTDSNPSSRITNAPLEESSFPPLPKSTRRSRQKSRSNSEGLGKNTMAARLRQRNNVTVVHSSRAWPAAGPGREPTSSMVTSQSKATSSSGSSMSKPASVIEFVPPGSSPRIITGLSKVNHSTPAPNLVNRGSFDPSPSNFPPVSATQTSKLATSFAQNSSGSLLRNMVSPNKVNHSTSASNLVNRGSFDPSLSNFPPVTATQTSKAVTSRQPLSKVEDVHTANKSLVERIRAVLEFDEDKYAAFKVISAEYRQGVIETGEYLAYVYQFGLSHLIPELARLCPDAQKQKELLEACNGQLKHKKGSKKGKEKVEDNGGSSFKAVLADSLMTSVKELQSRYDPSAETIEVLSKDGYRSAKGKAKVLTVHEQEGLSYFDQPQTQPRSQIVSKKIGGGNKPQKKTSKFHRVRLGDSSPAALLDLTSSDCVPDMAEEKSDGDNGKSEKLPIRGVWQNGGGPKLVGKLARRDHSK